MKRPILKDIRIRLISLLLMFTLLAGDSALAFAATKVKINQTGFANTMDLLYEVVSKNLKPYKLSPDIMTVKSRLLSVGKDEGLTEYYDEAMGVSYSDQILKVPVYDIIKSFIDEKNTANGYNEDGEATDEENPPTVAFIQYVDANGVSFDGNVMRTDYTYGNLICEYVRKNLPAAASLYDDVLLEQVAKHVTTAKPSGSLTDILKEITNYSNSLADQYTTNYEDQEYVDTLMNEHAITYYEYTRNHVVSPSTLFIGTYLIDANTINDVYYRYAKDTMGIYNQQIMYYKSELDSGHWKDIISAVGLSDILPTSDTVQDADLMQYKITCVIGSDGIPRYPDDDSEADIFTMTDPYDMAAVPELLPLKTLYDSGVVSQDTADVSNRYAADVLYRLFNYDGSGDNKSYMIIRNKAYRDYLHDHPEKSNGIIGANPIDMNITLNITEEEIRYMSGLGDLNIRFAANMPQTEDHYPGQNAAFYDQILAWAEYYATDKFSSKRDASGQCRPIILPAESFTSSGWELGNRNEDWKNPQSYMYILNGTPQTEDMKKFVDDWCSDTIIAYDATNRVSLASGNWVASRVNDVTSAITGIDYESQVAGAASSTDNILALTVFSNLKNTGASQAKITWGKKWNNFCDLMYRYMDWMRYFYDIRDDITRSSDESLVRLNEQYRTERDAGNVDDADTLMRLMSRVDATRRARIYYNMVYNEDNNYVVGPSLMYAMGLLQNGTGSLGQNFSYIAGAGETNFAANDAVLSAMEDAIVNCQKKYTEYNGIAFGEGKTVIQQKEYEQSLAVMNATDSATRHTALHDLAIIYNIEEGAIVDKDEEREMIDVIMDTCGKNYAAAIHDVANEDYLIAAADPSTSKGTLSAYLELQRDDANGDVAQLQNMIRAYALRLNTTQGIMFINRRLDWAEAQADDIQSEDPYGPYAMDSLKEHIAWLKKILAQIKNGSLDGNDPISTTSLKVEYKGQLLDALDNGDLDKADEIDDLLNRMDDEGDGSGTGNGDGTDDGGGDSSLDGANGDFGDLINDLEREILEDPNDTGRVPVLLEALAAVGDPNIGELEETLERLNADQGILDAAAGAKEDAANSELNPGGDGDDDSGDGNGDEDGVNITDADLIRAIENALGIKFEDLSDDDKAAVVAACTRFVRDREYEEVLDFGRRVQNSALSEDNPFFYHQFTGDDTTQYVNLAAVDRPRLYTGYRYVKRGRTVTMTQVGRVSMSGSLTFTIGSKTVTDRKGKTTEMPKNTVQQTDPYIRGSLTRNYAYIIAEDAYEYLDITCEYVPNTEYAVFLTKKIETKATAIYEAIDEVITELEEELAAKQKAAAEAANSASATQTQTNDSSAAADTAELTASEESTDT